MSVRGQPTSDPADACPFVAFEDERDERSTRPDHRHRCYAELRPAPRALAHQEAYCLSPSFADCPTFRDWARREAARARPPVRSADESHAEPVAYDAGYGRRQSDWTAPPPWSVGEGSKATAATGGEAAAAGAVGAAGRAAAETAGAPDAAPAADTPGFLTSRDRSTSAAEGAGLAASAAYAAAGPSPAGTDDEEDSFGPASPHAPTGESRPTVSPAPPARASRPTAAVDRAAHDAHDGRDATSTRSLAGPSWERPHRYEAYPTLRTRVGLPRIPRLALAAVAVLVAAVALFFLPTLVLRPGGAGEAGASSTPSSSGSSEASASIAPTPVPSPTALVHVVKQGETLSGIAAFYKVALPDLIAANKQIANPDKLKPGDMVNIPSPAPSDVLDVGAPSASPSG